MPTVLSQSQSVFFASFILLVLVGLLLDLGVFSKKKPHVVPFREALLRTSLWVGLGLLFAAVLYFIYPSTCGLETNSDFQNYKTRYNGDFEIGYTAAKTQHSFAVEATIKYLTGYLIEYSLSIDNLFVIMLIFSSFQVKPEYRKNILFWGVIGAIVLRFVFIFIGSALLAHFYWLMYLFGAILLISGFKMLVNTEQDDENFDPNNHSVVKVLRKILPISKTEQPNKFFVRENGKFMFSILFVVLVVVECTDLVFAVDSVPAIFGITLDPFLVFFSNIFAILGLRSLYFLLSQGLSNLHTLKYGLSIVLIFIGIKMIFEKWFEIIGFNYLHNLLVIFGIIALTIVSAYIIPAKSK